MPKPRLPDEHVKLLRGCQRRAADNRRVFEVLAECGTECKDFLDMLQEQMRECELILKEFGPPPE